jgi:hypothetical protein
MELGYRERRLGPGRLNDRKRLVFTERGHERRPLVIGHDNDRTLLQGHFWINARFWLDWRDPSLAVLMPCQQTAEPSANDRAVPKSFRHQRVKPELGQCLTATRIVVGASGEAKAAKAVGQGREQRALSEPLGPFLEIL